MIFCDVFREMIHCINCILSRTGKRVKWNTSMKCNKVEQQKISLVTLLCWRFVKTEKPRSEKCVVTLCSLLCNIIDCSNKWTECVYLLNNEMKWRRKIVKYFFLSCLSRLATATVCLWKCRENALKTQQRHNMYTRSREFTFSALSYLSSYIVIVAFLLTN